MIPNITIILTNYNRIDNVLKILNSIRMQSIPVKIFIWDNSLEFNELTTMCDWYVKSSVNCACSPRWGMAKQADTEYVLIMDDDIGFRTHNSLEYILSKMENTEAIGSEGVIITEDTYLGCKHIIKPQNDTVVDIIKGRFFLTKTEILKNINFNIPAFGEDDIIISSKIKDKKIIGGLQNHMVNLSDWTNGLCKRPDHYKKRSEEMKKSFLL